VGLYHAGAAGLLAVGRLAPVVAGEDTLAEVVERRGPWQTAFDFRVRKLRHSARPTTCGDVMRVVTSMRSRKAWQLVWPVHPRGGQLFAARNENQGREPELEWSRLHGVGVHLDLGQRRADRIVPRSSPSGERFSRRGTTRKPQKSTRTVPLLQHVELESWNR